MPRSDASGNLRGYHRQMDDADHRPLLTRWLRGGHLIALDVAAAVVVVVRFAGLGQRVGQPVFDGPLGVGWLVAGAVGLPIAVRRRWPLAVLGTVLVASIVANLLDMTREPYTATALALYTVALAEPGRRSVPALLVCLLGAGTGVLLGEGVITPSQPWTEALALVALVWLIMGAAWTVGRAVRERRASAARSAEQLTQQAVTEERLRIARELHDIVAHSMSLIAVKAGIANHVAEARPQEARDALRIIEATSRGALTDMRRLLGVLRPDADDQALLRGSFHVLVDTAPDLMAVGEAGTGAEAVELARRERPDVVLMDVRMPQMDGIEATRRICGSPETAGVRVLMLTTFDLDEYVYAALRAGASGFLLKDTPPGELLAAIRVIAVGEALLAPTVTRRLIAQFTRRPEPLRPLARELDGVTDREREVLALIARGLSNSEIAEHLHVSLATVKTHVGHLLAKLQARDRAQLVIVAYETGLVSATHQ